MTSERRSALEAHVATLSPAKQALFARRLAGRKATATASDAPAPKASTPRSGPLSFAEERFWAAYMLEDQPSAYHVPLTLHLKGRLDVSALQVALQTVVDRHDILRTRYPMGPEGDPVAVVDDAREVRVSAVDAGRDPRIPLGRAATDPFDLEEGPLIRTTLLKVSDDEHYLHFTLHHIVTDAWSTGILLDELTRVYTATVEGGEPNLPALTLQYRDYAMWHRAQNGSFARETAYWRQALAGVPGRLDLPTDRPRQQRQALVPGSVFMVRIPKEPALALARQTGATLFMVLLSAYARVLGRRADTDDVLIGTPVAGRGITGVEPLIGCFINTLAMRVDLSGDPAFGELASRVREVTLQAYDHQNLPIQQVSESLADRARGQGALFQAWLALQNVPDGSLHMAGLVVEEMPDAIETTKFDITLHVTEAADHLELRVEYDTQLFDEDTVRGFARDFSDLISAAASDPHRRLSALS
ncbi:condensation domain-containing protein [Streptomyces sp. NPDC006475]|uniref:condensation domain-containing protein n=1 Tax=Streptomyces sp. NPDC006475 TaxID=3155719 RepID=UPI0033BEBA0B